MGGDGQPQTQAAVFTRYALFGQSMQQAIAAPRWLLGRTWGQATDTLKLEARFAPVVVDELKRRGHAVEVIGALEALFEAATESITVYDLEGRIVRANAAEGQAKEFPAQPAEMPRNIRIGYVRPLHGRQRAHPASGWQAEFNIGEHRRGPVDHAANMLGLDVDRIGGHGAKNPPALGVKCPTLPGSSVTPRPGRMGISR